MNLFALVERHRRALLFTIACLVLAGVATMIHSPVSLFPDVTFPRIVILADNGEEPAERMMVEVTQPLEEAAGAVPGVRTVRSVTGRGASEVSISLDWGTDVPKALQQVQARISDARNQLPASASVRAEQMTVSVFPVQGYSLTSESIDPVQLRDIAMYQIRPAIMQVKGVARVEIEGGDTREFRVIVSPEKLAAYRLDVRQVATAIRQTNLVSSSGLVADNYQLYLSLVSGLLHTAEDIRNVVVVDHDGAPVRVGDVAEVAPGVADRFIRTTAHGQDAVLLNILKQPTGSTVQISRDVDAVVSSLKLPPGVRFENFYDQGDFIHRSIQSTRDSIIIGIVLAMLVMLLFLRSWGMTLVITSVVPSTIALTFVCLRLCGLSINIMTLGGIAAAVGLIIDDAIVVIENAFSHLGRAQTTDQSFGRLVGRSLHELMPAMIGSTASTVLINVPLAFLGGVTGAFFASLSLTMIFALLISFLLSITLAPLLASRILSRRDLEREMQREQRAEHSTPAALYGRSLRWFLRRRALAIPVALGLMTAAGLFYGRIGSSFMPEMDEGTFVLDYASPPGTSLEETDRVLKRVERILMDIPEVESYSRRTGTQLGFFLTEPNTGDFLVKLKPRRPRGINEVISDVRARVQVAEPTLQIDFGQLMMDVIGDLTNNPSPVEIKLFGDDPTLLHAKAAEVASLIEGLPGVVDVFDGVVISGPSVVAQVEPLAAARAGFTTEDVSAELEIMMRGSTETGIQYGKKVIPIRVSFPTAYRHDLTRLENAQLVNAAGTPVPLRQIARIERTGGQAEVHREGLRQMNAVTARIDGIDLESAIRRIKAVLGGRLTLPRSMSLEFGGVYQTQQESFRGLLVVAIAALLLVSLVLLFEFGEFAVPLTILVIDALSLVGVFGALWITGVTFNISSFVGVIMIIGIVAENSIFVLHRVGTLRRQGVELDEALVSAGIQRARPILMTTLGAVLALLPLAIGLGTGAKMQQPLAIAVIGGFSVSSLLLFFMLPVVYRLLAGGWKASAGGADSPELRHSPELRRDV